MVRWEGNWNPAPVALPDGRVRIMVHTGWSGKFKNVTGWSGEAIIEAPSWQGPYKIITSRDVRAQRYRMMALLPCSPGALSCGQITNCTKCEEDPYMWQDVRSD